MSASFVPAPAGHEIQAPAAARLELKPTIPTSAWVDGAWWPRTKDLSAELPPLLTALSGRVGTVAMVGYHLNAWDHTERQLDTPSGTIILQGFTADDPPTVLIIGTSGERITLVVVPSASGDAGAWSELRLASRPSPALNPAQGHADAAIDRSLQDLATRLAHLHGHAEDITHYVQDAARQFADAPVQAFVPILVEHIVRQKLGPPSNFLRPPDD